MPACYQNPLDVSAKEGNAIPFISGHHLVPLLIHKFPREGAGGGKKGDKRKGKRTKERETRGG